MRQERSVPFYQRAYVWTLEDQWEQLWEDIREKAEARCTNRPDRGIHAVFEYYLKGPRKFSCKITAGPNIATPRRAPVAKVHGDWH